MPLSDEAVKNLISDLKTGDYTRPGEVAKDVGEVLEELFERQLLMAEMLRKRR